MDSTAELGLKLDDRLGSVAVILPCLTRSAGILLKPVAEIGLRRLLMQSDSY